MSTEFPADERANVGRALHSEKGAQLAQGVVLAIVLRDFQGVEAKVGVHGYFLVKRWFRTSGGAVA
jgi:hypothetical protein